MQLFYLSNIVECSLRSPGGVIEACPPSESVTAITVNILIAPDNRVTLISSGDQIHAHSPFHSWGLSVPQSSVDPVPLNQACAKIAKSCLQRSVMGYITVDLVTFIDPTTVSLVSLFFSL